MIDEVAPKDSSWAGRLKRIDRQSTVAIAIGAWALLTVVTEKPGLSSVGALAVYYGLDSYAGRNPLDFTGKRIKLESTDEE